MKKENKLNFSVSSGIKDIVGKDLITNEITAIFELVKNSYDADALNVEIKINTNDDEIIIFDNGYGMSYEDIVNKWLFLAYSNKKNNREKNYAGSKGIGRFSADRLGEKLTLITKKENIISQIDINWKDFEENQEAKFESISIDYKMLDDYNLLDSYKSGTVLIIKKLRDIWDKNKINKVKKQIASLINPIYEESRKFEIKVGYVEENGKVISEIIKNPIKEILLEKTISIDVEIKEKTIEINLLDSGKKIYYVQLKNNTILSNINFLVYFMNLKAKINFTRIMKEKHKNYGNIFVYKNNFRILPYGNDNYDMFNLNLRKIQGYNRNLGLSDLLGWISIRDYDLNFKEVSSRENGFIRNEYFLTLENIYMDLVQKPLEEYVGLIKFGNLEINGVSNINQNLLEKLISRYKKYEIIKEEKYELPLIVDNIFNKTEELTIMDNDDDKEALKKNINENVKNLISQINFHEEKENLLEKQVEQLERQLNINNNLILRQKPDRSDYLEHELGTISSDINHIVYFIKNKLEKEQAEKISEELVNLVYISDKLRVILEMILRIENNTNVSKNRINLDSYLRTYLKNFMIISNMKINLLNEEKEIIQDINIFDFGIIIDNIVKNAKDLKANRLDIILNESGIKFISDTPAIKVEPIHKVFELGFSTKSRGYGIGLHLVKTIAERFNWEISAQNIADNLVMFEIKFKDVIS